MKVLVTGGSGFIGARLVDALCEKGYKVFVLSRKRPGKFECINSAVEIIQCDLLDASSDLERLVADCLVVFNCAGELHNEALMEALHVSATLRLVQACKKVAKATGNPIHWVQLSSVGAYGLVPITASSERVVTEETAPAPVGAYEVTKTKADELIVAAMEDDILSYSILRPSNVYGQSMPNNSIRQWGRAIQKGLFVYVGQSGAISTYVHVDDVVCAMLLCGFDRRAKGEVFNISNDCPQEEMVNAIANAVHVVPPRLRVPEVAIRLVSSFFSRMKGFPLTCSRIDSLVARTRYPTDKLHSILNYRPSRTVKSTIEEVFLETVN